MPRLFFFILLLFVGTCAKAQVQPTARTFSDSLQALRKKCYSTPVSYEAGSVSPYYYRLLGPSTYYSSAVGRAMSLNQQQGVEDEPLLSAIDDQLLRAYMSQPQAFQHYERQFQEVDLVNEAASTRQEVILGEMEQKLKNDVKAPVVEDIAGDIGDIGLKVERPNFWKTEGKFSLQFTQNYFSENWYKGGNNNQTMLASLILQANYNDQRRVTWDNKLEMRLGFVTTTSDSCHTFLTNNDKLNFYSKLGVKAAKSWYYALSAEANSQFLPGYRTNDRRTYSNFLSPLDVYISLGMDFKPALKNGNKLSVALLPLSYKIRYIHSDDENIHKVLKMEGSSWKKDIGTKVELNSQIKLAKNIDWKCRFYYFTSYEYAESELENALSFAFTKYISTELYTLWRFDDNRSRDDYDRNLGYFQFKEYFTLGLTYSF